MSVPSSAACVRSPSGKPRSSKCTTPPSSRASSHLSNAMRLQGKVIIVTGSCTGIGKAIAERVVAEGARVVIHGLEHELGDEVVAALGRDKAALHIEDLTLEGAPDRLVETAVSAFGKLDAVVNNAALVAPSNLYTTDLPFFRKMLEINTIAPFALIKAALPYLRETRGSVLNI